LLILFIKEIVHQWLIPTLIQYTWYSLSQTRRFKRLVQENNYNIEHIVQWIRLCLPREMSISGPRETFLLLFIYLKKNFYPIFRF